jgi:BRCA1-associated protein
VCGQENNLWVCLVCGNVGCARYANEHAVAHFRETGHNYSLDTGTRRVWDYCRDRYAHRIGEGDGVDTGECAGDAWGTGMEKMETMSFEYSLLLASQLETQSQLYDDRLVRPACAHAGSLLL